MKWRYIATYQSTAGDLKRNLVCCLVRLPRFASRLAEGFGSATNTDHYAALRPIPDRVPPSGYPTLFLEKMK